MGIALKVSPDAARMRVERALEKLRVALERRGINTLSAALATVLATQGTLAVPSAMVATVTGAVMATGAATAVLGVVVGMKAALVGAGLVAVIGSIWVAERNRSHAAETQLSAIRDERASLQGRLINAEAALLQAQARAAEVEKDNSKLLEAVEAAKRATASRPAPPTTAPTPTPPLVGDPKWNQFPGYLGALVEKIQVQWERTLTEKQLQPPSGSTASVTFILSSDGTIAEITEVSGTAGQDGAAACATAIISSAPHGVWTADMRNILGERQQLTFTFAYRGASGGVRKKKKA
jgi:hypothetical protein